MLLLNLLLLLPPTLPFTLPTPPSSNSPLTTTLVVLGDLHLEDDIAPFLKAKRDIKEGVKSIKMKGREEKEEEEGGEAFMERMMERKVGSLTMDELRSVYTYKSTGTLQPTPSTYMISLGDLGRKEIRHLPGDAGTTESFKMAKDYLDGFDFPYGIITGNHDLEGLDEFTTDNDNIIAFHDVFRTAELHGSSTPTEPYWCKELSDDVVLIGLCTTRFREAVHSSHEVYVDDVQMEWFEDRVRENKEKKVIVFSHAPPLGSGLKILQDVHLRNGCAYINHSGEIERARRFIGLVKDNPQIKLWFSGHYHLSHDFQDSISNVGSCTFVQCGVIGGKSTRDDTRQTRVVEIEHGGGAAEVYTINHHLNGEVRMDARCDFGTGRVERVVVKELPKDGKDLQRAYTPKEEDGCYSKFEDDDIGGVVDPEDMVCWWHMDCGRVLGCHDGKLLEYDSETLAPLGIVVEELKDKEIRVVNKGKVLVVMDKGDESVESLEVVQPNADGSYWRRFQRNKKQRLDEKKRVEIAKSYLEREFS